MTTKIYQWLHSNFNSKYCAFGELSTQWDCLNFFALYAAFWKKEEKDRVRSHSFEQFTHEDIAILPLVWQKSMRIAFVSSVSWSEKHCEFLRETRNSRTRCRHDTLTTTGYQGLRLQFHPTIEESTKVQGGRISFSLGHLASQKIPFWGQEHWSEMYCECWSEVVTKRSIQ